MPMCGFGHKLFTFEEEAISTVVHQKDNRMNVVFN